MLIAETKLLTSRNYSVIHHEEIDNERLMQSVVSYGQLRPIIVTQDFFVIDGMRLLRCIKEMSSSAVSVQVLPGISTANDIARVYLQMNLTHADIDVLAFANLLQQLQKQEMPLSGIARATNHSIDEVKEILKLLTFNWANFEQVPDETNQLSLL